MDLPLGAAHNRRPTRHPNLTVARPDFEHKPGEAPNPWRDEAAIPNERPRIHRAEYRASVEVRLAELREEPKWMPRSARG